MAINEVWHDDAVLTDLLLGVGMAAHLPCDEVLTLQDHHPANHPGFQLQVRLDDDIVIAADPRVGLMHRSAEKLFEARDYRQAMLLANRHDWLSAFTSELGVALTLESALGLTPPGRATWIRTLLAEANRISASLAFLAPVSGAMRAPLEALRERLASLQEQVTGGRVHPGFARIGGVAWPIDSAGLADYERAAAEVDASRTAIHDAIGVYTQPLAGVATVSAADAVAYGLSGTVGRASGLNLDLRRDDPYLAYEALLDLLDLPTKTGGDVPARYAAMVDQLPVSAAIVRACADELRRLGDGPVDVPLPKVVRLPEGVTYCWVEGPLGISGCLVASVGDRSPWRMKIRSASFATMQVLGCALVGTSRADLADAVMSFPFVLGDVDR